MFPRLALLPIGLFLIWCFVCQRWYVCHIKQKCSDAAVVPPPTDTVDNRPIVFKWSDANPVTRPNFTVYRDSILKGLPQGHFLEITGLYGEGEKATDGFANIGLARGDQLKAIFSKFVPTENIVVSSDLMKEQPDTTGGFFVASRFNYRKPPEDQGKKTVECLEQGGGLTILFPYGRAQYEVDKKIEDCLAELVAFMKDNPTATVSITGHTDSAGSQEFNIELGMGRAKHIMGIIVKQGIERNRVTIESKGEDQPVASNDTEEGSRLNRRAVLVLNNKPES